METTPTIDRRYQILASLGSGLSGEIYKVQGPEGVVALKLLKRTVPGLKTEENINHFKFEFSLLKGLTHPNIVRIHDFGFDERLKRFYFTEELVEGTGLLEFSKKASRETLQELFLQALQGLAYLHSHDVIHGDLKPDNLLITAPQSEHPTLKIIDFGVSHPSLVGYAGTPAYMAPEKILKEPVDGRSDLYSLATVFYTALTGENPFLRKTVLATLQAHLKFTPPSATAKLPQLDPTFSELLAMMLKKNPRYRIDSAEACIKFLETKGEVQVALKKPRLLPRFWIGRPEILEEAKKFLNTLSTQPDHHLLQIVGEKGLGKDTLLTELKYEAELKGIEVLTLEAKPERSPALYFLHAEELEKIFRENRLSNLLQNASVLAAMLPELAKEVAAKMAARAPVILHLRPLTEKETEEYLQYVTRNKVVPPPFLHALFRFSRGYPGSLHEALQGLLQDPLIVDSSGKWNLAVFHEVEPSLEQLGFSESALAQALVGDWVEDPKERFSINSLRAYALANQGKLDESLALLNKLEGELPEIFDRPQRLVERAGLLAKRGWVYTKQARYQEAREAFASALSLIVEGETPSPVLETKVKNFISFLDLQEGRVEEAIKGFESTAEQVRDFNERERREITNNELGQAYLAAGKTGEAILRLQEDLEFFKTLSDSSFLLKTYYNLGEAFLKEQNYEEAAKAYQNVAEISRERRDWDYLIRAYNGLGNIASLSKDFSASLDYYQRSLNLAEYRRDFLCAATVAQNRGSILSELGRLEESQASLELSKQLLGKIHPSSHSRYLMARATLELGELFRKKKDFPTAKNYFTEALNRSEEDPNLKTFRFYPLHSLAAMALQENNFEGFRELYPKLVHLAQTEEEKTMLSDLIAKAPADPTKGMEGPALPEKPGTVVTPLSTDLFNREALSQILRVNRALLVEHDTESLFQKILEYATDLSKAEAALLLQVAEDDSLQVLAAFNIPVDSAQKEISEKIARQVLASGEPIVTADAQVDGGFNQFESVVALHLRSIACFPIRVHQKVIGLLYLTHRYQTNLFSSQLIRILEAFSDQAGLALQNARYVRQLQELNRQLQNQLEDAEEEIDRLKSDLRSRVKNPYPKILGKSRAIVEILQLLDRISDTTLSVLITGETGSGKELVARSIHDHSRRHKGPFVAVNCGAIPENLIESELFGYRAGAFTGATRDKRGLVEEAGGGTLFLDEIAELPSNTQVKLLRVLQEKEIRRLGDTQATAVDIRVLVATNRDVSEWVKEGKFREDLYYRVAQMILHVPGLRERKEDLLLLAEHFLGESAKELGLSKPPRLHKDLLEKMMEYDWPGNVRELENFLRTAAAFAERGAIHTGNLPAFLLNKLEEKLEPPPITPSAYPPPNSELRTPNSKPIAPRLSIPPSPLTWDQYEAALFARTLLKHEMNCEKAATELGVGVATVYLKMRKYGLKQNAAKYEHLPVPIPEGMTAAALKQKLIQETYQREAQSPYAVAKQLNLNVGTVYRYLKENP